MELGQILKQLREKKDVTTSYLAKKIGVSSSHISQIESNKSSPSISVLKKIANVLGVPINYFFSEEKNSTVIKEHERKKLVLPDCNVAYELLSPSEIRDYQFLLARIAVDGKTGEEPSVHTGQKSCYIMKGVAACIIDNLTYEIKEGESIYIPENKPHNIVNIGQSEVIIISVISPASV